MSRRVLFEEFIDRIPESTKLSNMYQYDSYSYMGTHKFMNIICKVHGVFLQKPIDHIKGHGCPRCAITRNSITIEDIFIHIKSPKYTCTGIIYKNRRSYANMVCVDHGNFTIRTDGLYAGKGCPKCGKEHSSFIRKLSFSDFYKRANIIHNNYYDYVESTYSQSNKKVNIICPKHGKFSQTAGQHLLGVGCPACSSSKGELAIQKFLSLHDIAFSAEYKFDECKDKYRLPFDFVVFTDATKSVIKTIIEYDGMQHYIPSDMYGGQDSYKLCKIHDDIKNEFCKKHNYKLLRIPYTKLNNIDNILLSELSDMIYKENPNESAH